MTRRKEVREEVTEKMMRMAVKIEGGQPKGNTRYIVTENEVLGVDWR